MKREAIGHTKMRKLCVYLNCPQYMAVGLLESLWHLTAREAWRGDIGKLSDDDIAIGLDYRGDPVELIGALCRAKWVDRDDTHRLVVHDWSEHADDAVQVRVARAREFFADGRAPKLVKLGGNERDGAKKWYEEHVRTNHESVRTEEPLVRTTAHNGAQNDSSCAPPEPEPLPVLPPIVPQSGDTAPPSEPKKRPRKDPTVPICPHVERLAKSLHARHLRERSCSESQLIAVLNAIFNKNPKRKWDDLEYQIDKSHEIKCASYDWQKDNGQFVTGLKKWLREAEYEKVRVPPRRSELTGLFVVEPPREPPPSPATDEDYAEITAMLNRELAERVEAANGRTV